MRRELPLLLLFFALTIILLSVQANAVSVGSNVAAVGGGYPKFYDMGVPEFVYYTTDNGGEIHVVFLNEDGTVGGDATIVTNVANVRSVCIDRDGYVWFFVYGDGIYKRATKYTNPYDFSALKTDPNYFVKVSSVEAAYDLTPQGNRIYYHGAVDDYNIYYIDIDQNAVGTLATVPQHLAYSYGIVEIAANSNYVYALSVDAGSTSWAQYITVVDHDGNIVQDGIQVAGYSSYGSGEHSDIMFLSNDTIEIYTLFDDGAIAKKCSLEGYLVNASSVTDTGGINFAYWLDFQSAGEIHNSKYAVFLNDFGQAETKILEGVYEPEPPSEEPGSSPTPPPDEPGETPYAIELSAKEVYPGQTLRVFVREKGLLWDSYVEGASVYVDGEYIGKTAYRSWYGRLFGFIGLEKPYVPVTAETEGVHTVYAIHTKGKSNTATFTVLGSDDLGGTPEGTYPRAPSGDENTVYELRADKTTVYLTSSQGEEVTFRVYRLMSGEERGTVEARIYINGEPVGKTSKSLFFGDYELKYMFTDPGIYKVFAEIGDVRTGELWITVLDRISEIDPSDGGTISLTVRVTDENGRPLSGIVVQRLENDAFKEQRITSADGAAVLHPVSGVNYTILAIDPSGEHLPISYEGSWTSDDTLSLTMRSSGAEVSSIHVTVDGSGDGAEILIGKHRIYVRDDSGRALSGAMVYVNDEPVGRTSKPFWDIFGEPYVEYTFSIGNYTVMGTYEGKTDVISVSVISDPNAVIKLAWKVHSGISKFLRTISFEPYQFTREIRVQHGLLGAPLIELTIVDGSGKKIGGEIYIDGEHFATLSEGEVCYFQPTGDHVINASVYGVEADNSPLTVEAEEETSGGTFFFENIGLPPITGISFLDSILWLLLLLILALIVLKLIFAIL